MIRNPQIKIAFVLSAIVVFGAVSIFGQVKTDREEQFIVILGTAQDAGYPQIGCEREECTKAQQNRALREAVVSLGIVDLKAGKKWLVKATPDIGEQLFTLNSFLPSRSMMPDGIFLTHAHIGHYTGLMYLGREAAGASKIPVYAMPRMRQFLRSNAPWSQLVDLQNISISDLENETDLKLSASVSIRPFHVPHRDEFSETVGFEIKGANKSALFIPDIDKWGKWDKDLKEVVKKFDHVLIDATFFKNGELPNRDMSEVPHPFVSETVEILKDLSKEDKSRIVLIHFNHTNPLIRENSEETRSVLKMGFRIARTGTKLAL